MGEKCLIVAVIHRAVHDAYVVQWDLNKSRQPQHRREALAWLRSKDDSPMSFKWCLAHLGLDKKTFWRNVDFRSMSVSYERQSKKTRGKKRVAIN